MANKFQERKPIKIPIIKKINLGDLIKAKIVDIENEDGYVELSLKEAKQALIWAEADKAIKAKTVMDLEIKDANKKNDKR